jgi:hypothetical protein
VLALLAAEVDLYPVPEDVLRRRLADLGRWPLPTSDDRTVPAAAALPETRVLDLREAWPAEPAVLRPAVRQVPSARRGTDEEVRPAPRQVRVRLVAVAAVAAVGLWGVGLAVTGTSNPMRAGSILAGTDDGSRIQNLLDDGLELVSANDLSAGRANLESAYAWSKTADLTPDQRRRVEEGLEKLSAALSREGVALPVTLRPGTISTKGAGDGAAASPGEPPASPPVPVADSAPVPTSPDAGTPDATAVLPPASPSDDDRPSSSSTTGPVPTTASRTTGPVTSQSSTHGSGSRSGDRSGSSTKRTKTRKTDD